MARKKTEDCVVKFYEDEVRVHSPCFDRMLDRATSVFEMLKSIGLSPKAGDSYLITIERTMPES